MAITAESLPRNPNISTATVGKDFLLCINTGTYDAPTWVVVGGQRNSQISQQADSIDVSDKTNNGWTSTLAGMKSWSVDLSGLVMLGDEGVYALETAFRASMTVDMKFMYPDESFQRGWASVTEFSKDVPHDGAATLSGKLSGNGELSAITPSDGSKLSVGGGGTKPQPSEEPKAEPTPTSSDEGESEADALPSFTLTGDNERDTWNFLREVAGYDEMTTAAIMGNIAHESNFKPNNVEGAHESRVGSDEEYTAKVNSGTYDTEFINDSVGYGLAQWTYSTRKAELLRYTRSHNVPIDDMLAQLAFFDLESKRDFASVVAQIKEEEGIATKTATWCREYERPTSGGYIPTRQAKAIALYEKYTGKTYEALDEEFEPILEDEEVTPESFVIDISAYKDDVRGTFTSRTVRFTDWKSTIDADKFETLFGLTPVELVGGGAARTWTIPLEKNVTITPKYDADIFFEVVLAS